MKTDKNGCSTCPIGEEQFEVYAEANQRRGKKKVTRVQYDYRHDDGKLFSTDRSTLKECRDERNAWVEKNYPDYDLMLLPNYDGEERFMTIERGLEIAKKQIDDALKPKGE